MKKPLILGILNTNIYKNLQAQFDDAETLTEVLDIAVKDFKMVGIAASMFTPSTYIMQAQVIL